MGIKNDLYKRIDEIYSLYPRKLGKTPGYKVAIAQCKDMQTLQLLETAVINYKVHVVREAKEPEFILYFSTFMRQWRDWLEDGHGLVAQDHIDLSDAGFDD